MIDKGVARIVGSKAKGTQEELLFPRAQLEQAALTMAESKGYLFAGTQQAPAEETELPSRHDMPGQMYLGRKYHEQATIAYHPPR